jgi:predicted ATP-dependent protease
VGVFEESAGATGPAWRSTFWLAAWMGTVLADRYAEGWRISFEGQRGTRRVEGPSAGAAFAVSVAASIRGDRLRSDSVLTGTLLPDGGVGPVDGILQ